MTTDKPQIFVTVPKEIKSKVVELAAQEDLSLSQYCLKALMFYWEHGEEAIKEQSNYVTAEEVLNLLHQELHPLKEQVKILATIKQLLEEI